MLVQGMGPLTELKQANVKGIAKMRCLMFQSWITRGEMELRFRDALCGDGENVFEGKRFQGSPISILEGIEEAAECSKKGLRYCISQIELRVSDVRQDAIDSLTRLIDDKFEHRPDLFSRLNSYSSLVKPECLLAANAIENDIAWLKGNSARRLFLFIDPTGPTDLPYPQVAKILRDRDLKRRVDVLLYISATAIKRILSVPTAQKKISEWIGNFRTLFIEAIDNADQAWIRKPIDGDSQQWTMLMYWAPPLPRDDWNTAGFVRIGSPEGQSAVEKFTNTRNSGAT